MTRATMTRADRIVRIDDTTDAATSFLAASQAASQAEKDYFRAQDEASLLAGEHSAHWNEMLRRWAGHGLMVCLDVVKDIDRASLLKCGVLAARADRRAASPSELAGRVPGLAESQRCCILYGGPCRVPTEKQSVIDTFLVRTIPVSDLGAEFDDYETICCRWAGITLANYLRLTSWYPAASTMQARLWELLRTDGAALWRDERLPGEGFYSWLNRLAWQVAASGR